MGKKIWKRLRMAWTRYVDATFHGPAYDPRDFWM